MTTLLAAWLAVVIIANAGISVQAGSQNYELEKNGAAPGNINFDDSEFWFTNKFLSTNWKSVMLQVAPFLNEFQRDIVMTNAGYKRINPLVIITELVLKHQSDKSASTDYAEIVDNFTDSLLQFDDIFQQLEEKPKPNSATFSLWSALAENDENLAQFVSLHKELSGHESISSDSIRSNTYQEVNDRDTFTMQFPWPIGAKWSGGGTHSTTGSGSVWSSLDFYDGKQSGWGSTTPWVSAAHSGTVTVFSPCNIQITHSSGYATSYYHMEDLKFQSNDQIKQGDAIGRYADDLATALCRGGRSTGPHVHFTLLKNGKPTSLQDKVICGYKINAGNKNYDTDCSRFYYMKNDQKTCARRWLLNDDCGDLTSPTTGNFRKVEKKHCWNDRYGSYSTLAGAKSACESDSNCGMIYNRSCDNKDFYLCPKNSKENVSGSSCLYIKETNSNPACQCNDKGRQDNPVDGDWCWLEETPCKMLTGTIAADNWTWVRCSHNGQQQVNCKA